MPQTPSTSATAYATAADLFAYHDWQQVADMVRDGDGPRPSRAALADATSESGAAVAKFLLLASGELESACRVGNRYLPADIAALTGAGAEYRDKLVSDLAFWRLAQRRQPGTGDPRVVPGAVQALEALTDLRDGHRIFGLLESAEAGLPSAVEPDPAADGRTFSTVNRARRLFGTRGRDDRR